MLPDLFPACGYELDIELCVSTCACKHVVYKTQATGQQYEVHMVLQDQTRRTKSNKALTGAHVITAIECVFVDPRMVLESFPPVWFVRGGD